MPNFQFPHFIAPPTHIIEPMNRFL